MKSKWYEYKDTALKLRRQGVSMTRIERQLGIPRSTLSGWFKKAPLTPSQQAHLEQNRRDGWAKARKAAVTAHNNNKVARLKTAEDEALRTLAQLSLTDAEVELALAMLYLGEGAKSNTTSLSSSSPVILRFFVSSLSRLYNVAPHELRCDLHLRADQDESEIKDYWCAQLGIPLACFKYTAFDRRTAGKATYAGYKGVCVVSCGRIAIQRKLVMLYTLFCKKVESLNVGA